MFNKEQKKPTLTFKMHSQQNYLLTNCSFMVYGVCNGKKSEKVNLTTGGL